MCDEDKPFMCSELGCGMSFTNEDHLSVHMRKHDMSLALNLSTGPGGLSPMALFTDQTPTPTKFLRNCEELGLFQELSKNPFDDSFKKANTLYDPLDQNTEDSSVPIPGPEQTDLDTPQVSIPKIVIGNDDVLHEGGAKSSNRQRESSIVPKKRKKFFTQSIPTSTTSEDEDEPAIGSSSTETEMGPPAKVRVESPLARVSSSTTDPGPATTTDSVPQLSKPVPSQPVLSPQQTVAQQLSQIPSTQQGTSQLQTGTVMMQVMLQLPGGQAIPIQVPATTLTQQQVAISPTQIIQLGSTTQQPQPQIITNPSQNIPQVVVQQAGQQVIRTVPDNLPHVVQKTVQAGTTLNLTNVPLHLQTVTLGTSVVPQTGIQTVLTQTGNPGIQSPPGKQNSVQIGNITTVISPQNNVIKVSPGNSNVSPKNSGSQSYTKQRLKAALQQQLTPSSNKKISQIFQMVSEIKQEPQTSPVAMETQGIVSSPGSVSSTEDRIPKHIPGTQVVPDSPDDAESRRKRFLERNRAAAARCRQKRKHWVVNLETKAEELTSINSKLSNEIKALRAEVYQLKTLLLAHKDCPVTQQQKSQGQITAQTYEIDEIIRTSVSDHSVSVGIKSEIPTPMPVTQSTAGLVPVTIDLVPTTSQVPAALSVTQSTTGLVPVSLDMVPNILNMNLATAGNDGDKISVITGPNSLSVIPKILNIEQLMKTSHKS